MIKILVISDTHGDTSMMNLIFLSHQNYDYFLHLGDSQIPDYMMLPYVSVKGNCDFGNDYPPTRTIHTKYGDIYMEHGNHLLDEEYIKSKNVRIFLHGHTHKHYSLQLDDGTYVANPGSLTRPRDGTKGTYLEIEMDDKDIRFTFKEINED